MFWSAVVAASIAAQVVSGIIPAGGAGKNVLVIIIDDLRPDLGAYGRKEAKTPFLDELAHSPKTLVIDRAYAQFALCAPSRSSFMMGLYPDSLGMLKQTAPLDSTNRMSLPTFLRNNMLDAICGGKIFQPGQKGTENLFQLNLFPDYTRYRNSKKCGSARNEKPMHFDDDTLTSDVGCIVNGPIKYFPDYILANKVVQKIKEIDQSNLANQSGRNFALFVGLSAHLPFRVHQKYWRMIKPATIVDVANWDKGGPQPEGSYSKYLTLDPSMPLSGNGANPNPWESDPNALPDESYRKLTQAGYFALIAQTDEFIGKILNTLNQTTTLKNNTLVIVMADHGFLLGENRMWGKEVLFDPAIRVPMMFHVPWLNAKQSEKIKRSGNDFFLELVDVYRTIAGFLDISSSVPSSIEGYDKSSFITAKILNPDSQIVKGDEEEILRDPKRRSLKASFSMIARCETSGCYDDPRLATVSHIGYSITTAKYHYVVYFRFEGGHVKPRGAKMKDVLQQELYLTEEIDKETIFNFQNGTSFATDHENVFQDHPEICQALFNIMKDKFSW